MVNKTKVFPIANQALLLRKMYPNSIINTHRDKELTWKDELRPTPLSDLYTVKVKYVLGSFPNVYVVNPKPLVLARGATKLPHVYNQNDQRLCLFYPDSKQWNKSMPIATTIVFWIYEWLYHYEIWLGTEDEWKGGGIHPNINKPKIEVSKITNKIQK